ncbi:hypothetical protein [Legionella waltersii]|uniref:Uncharacterized protein n=1 Tax=Legionella waltersii TaxID=66969 RepID=A0A0W1A016_9GAMM|nr:hypothetical protein [Legionella waltersii]KTD74666.1 hypothetical protein Lwal_2707 [Legionella waltersii]SNV09121.1 Uncharacterised protein [Legionella waltersii]
MFSKSTHQNKRLDKKTGLPIPLTSLEAYQILQDQQSCEVIERVVRNFQNLVNTQTSVLVDLQKGEAAMNNQEFLDQLIKTSGRLISALKCHTPYSTLFGDLVKFKSQLQVILRYYQTQIATGQPIAKQFVMNAEEILPSIHTEGLLSDSESMELLMYSINYCADDIMKNDLKNIYDFILDPFLLDHSKEEGFSYFRP